MREKWARLIVLFTGLTVLLLAMVFAFVQNPEEGFITSDKQVSPGSEQKTIELDSKRVEQGRLVYLENNCSGCHSIAGIGNPRIPLDNVGSRYTEEELRNWVTGADSLQGILSDRTRRVKQIYKALSENELNNLISYLKNQKK